MRIACEVVFLRMTAGPRPQQKASKGQKAFVVLEKLKKNPIQYQIRFSVSGDKNGTTFLLDKSPIIVSPLLKQGKITMNFEAKPPVSVLVSKANPEDLAQLLDCIRRIGKGEPVDVDTVKIKSSDFKPSQIVVKDLLDYSKQRNAFSEFLTTIIFEPINLRVPDRKWASCANLTSLTLNGNPFLTNSKDMDVMARLKSLRILKMSNCHLGMIPWPQLRDMFKKLTSNIKMLDISENQLPMFPPLFHMRELQHLNISNNHIKYFPSRIGVLYQLVSIDVSGNAMSSLPYIFPRLPNIQSVAISGNDNLIRIADEVEPPQTKRILSKIDNTYYTHPGGVDTLKTIAANVFHRHPEVMKLRILLPLCLRFHVDDLTYEAPTVSGIEMCTSCRRIRHIRYVRPVLMQSGTIANAVDVFDRFVTFTNLFCIDCYRPSQGHAFPVEKDFFQHSL